MYHRPIESKQLDLARTGWMERKELAPVWGRLEEASPEAQQDAAARVESRQSAAEWEARDGLAAQPPAAPARARVWPARAQLRLRAAPDSAPQSFRAVLRRRSRVHAHFLLRATPRTLPDCRWARVQNGLATYRLRPHRWSWSASLFPLLPFQVKVPGSGGTLPLAPAQAR